MMEFKRVEITKIDENKLAEDLEYDLKENLEYYDMEFARTLSEENKLKILDKIGEIWHNKYLQYIADNKSTLEEA